MLILYTHTYHVPSEHLWCLLESGQLATAKAFFFSLFTENFCFRLHAVVQDHGVGELVKSVPF